MYNQRIKYLWILFGIGFPFLMNACGTNGTNEANSYGTGPVTVSSNTVDFNTLYTEVLEPNCVHCHGSSFSSESFILNYVTPGDPSSSTLYTDVASGRMPLNGPVLSADRINLVADYINALSGSGN